MYLHKAVFPDYDSLRDEYDFVRAMHNSSTGTETECAPCYDDMKAEYNAHTAAYEVSAKECTICTICVFWMDTTQSYEEALVVESTTKKRCDLLS